MNIYCTELNLATDCIRDKLNLILRWKQLVHDRGPRRVGDLEYPKAGDFDFDWMALPAVVNAAKIQIKNMKEGKKWQIMIGQYHNKRISTWKGYGFLKLGPPACT